MRLPATPGSTSSSPARREALVRSGSTAKPSLSINSVNHVCEVPCIARVSVSIRTISAR
jgi:hypothetical protein